MGHRPDNSTNHTVTVWRNGIRYHGSYTVDGQHLTVRLGTATISGKLPHSADPPLAIAADLLTKLVSEQRQDL